MGNLVLGTASGVAILLAALAFELSILAAIAAQSMGGMAVTLGAAGLQARAANRRARERARSDALRLAAPAGANAPREPLRAQSA